MEGKKGKDFRAGDPVCTWALGTGRVVRVNNISGTQYPITVEFDNGSRRQYSTEGKIASFDCRVYLFHGTFDQVFGQVKDVKPVRKVTKYINIFHDHEGLASWFIFDAEILAKQHAEQCPSVSDYIAVAVPVEVEE